ncbi:MAG: Asp-tRNA(Asn)/Glu-tRNA(Gln) amidotransferase subunit GatC [Roseiflexaceae bacterium]|nr:Asp-tRNA(Asn)/Glu-tRNA(Gln) amidotransferase subunit GatC [Roseiflexaceae bacterium]
MALTLAETEHVAHLARLRLSAEELEKMRAQLSNILEYIEMLQDLDVSDIPLTAQVTDLVNITRPDAITPSLTHADALSNAPVQADGMFRVSAIFEEE